MSERFIFEASRCVAGRCWRPAPADRVVLEGFGRIASTPALRQRLIGKQLRHAQQTVAADGECRHERHTRQAAYPHLAQRPTVLTPAEDLFDALAQALAGQIAAMTRRAPIDRRATRTVERLGDVRRDTHPA